MRHLPDVSLAIVGDAADESLAREVARWHARARGVHVVRGMRRRGRELACSYAAADFLASASDFETFGNTCAEAAACGTPALVQRGPGFVDQVGASPQWTCAEREDTKEDGHAEHLFCSDRGALLDYAAPDAAALVSAAVRALRPLLRDPDRVRRAVAATERRGTTTRTLLDAIGAESTRHKRPSYLLLALALFVSCVLRVFVELYLPYLRGLSGIVRCLPALRESLRPPARRVRWAGALVGHGCIVFRQNLASIRSFDLTTAAPSQVDL